MKSKKGLKIFLVLVAIAGIIGSIPCFSHANFEREYADYKDTEMYYQNQINEFDLSYNIKGYEMKNEAEDEATLFTVFGVGCLVVSVASIVGIVVISKKEKKYN